MLRPRLVPSAAATVSLFVLVLWYMVHAHQQHVLEINVPAIEYSSGTPKPPGVPYTKTIVMAKLESEDTSWLQYVPNYINRAVYVVDKPALSPGFRVPINKGHEGMAYLTYIIDHYYNLSDTTIFIHAHRTSWHNNDLLDWDILKTLQHMSDDHVARVGYFNTRCHHEPGCPDWLHLDRPKDQLDTYRKMEERAFSIDVWHELHPGVAPPPAISQPCCAQFAVSSQRIQAIPLSEYIRYRDWLTHTKLVDDFSGRIMEYSWQYIFAGVPELCPAINYCYCEGYGICMGGPSELQHWLDLRAERKNVSERAHNITDDPSKASELRELRDRAHTLKVQLEQLKSEAFDRGQDPKARAAEGGRSWGEGDGS
jgi:hypothetical protein